MSSRIEVRRTETVDGDDYIVEVEIVDAVGVPKELLVYRGEVFDHVAALRDIALYPPGAALAQSLGQEFHREASVRLAYGTPGLAREAGVYIENHIAAVRREYDAAQPPYFGFNAVTVYP
jgi:hypothetical protein